MIDKNKYIQFEDLNNDPNIIHFYTKKPLNFNPEMIEESIIAKEYEEIHKLLNYQSKIIIKPNQKHTNIVKKVEYSNINDRFDNTDGLITNLKDVALVTSTADCQAILLYDFNKKVIGNIHSGWRGTANRIIENAINIMINDYNCNSKDIKAYICPSILKCCFEVEEEVKEEFISKFKDIDISDLIKKEKNKYKIDLVTINIRVMERLGILKQNIIKSNICTKCNTNNYHSYRGDGTICGRNIAYIALK